MKVRHQKGDIVEKDINCDSDYLLESMKRVGKAIREKMDWIAKTKTIYLFIDGARGHGTADAIKTYTTALLRDYNVTIVKQIPRSPYTNTLDLGVWCGLQARVEKQHYMKCCDVEALVRSVMRTWDNNDLDEMITKVYKRLKKVFVLIKMANGGNDLVETKRGKKFKNLDMNSIEQLTSGLPESTTTNDEIAVPQYFDIIDEDCSDDDDE